MSPAMETSKSFNSAPLESWKRVSERKAEALQVCRPPTPVCFFFVFRFMALSAPQTMHFEKEHSRGGTL